MKENNNTGTGNSRIKKSHLYFLKSNYIWFKKHFFNESKEREPEKMSDIGKVRTFWEAHLIWKNLWRKSADLSKPWGIFLCILESLNFILNAPQNNSADLTRYSSTVTTVTITIVCILK